MSDSQLKKAGSTMKRDISAFDQGVNDENAARTFSRRARLDRLDVRLRWVLAEASQQVADLLAGDFPLPLLVC